MCFLCLNKKSQLCRSLVEGRTTSSMLSFRGLYQPRLLFLPVTFSSVSDCCACRL